MPRKHFRSVAITAKAAEGQCKAAQDAPQLGLITDHWSARNHNLSTTILGALLYTWVQSSEHYAAVSKSLFQCAQHMNSYVHNTLTWDLLVAQHNLCFLSLDDPVLRITPARNGLSSQTSMPQGSVARPALLLCLPDVPTHASSSFKAFTHLFYCASYSTTAAMSTYPEEQSSASWQNPTPDAETAIKAGKTGTRGWAPPAKK